MLKVAIKTRHFQPLPNWQKLLGFQLRICWNNMKTKICQNCKKEFLIEKEDFNFYEKIKVPPPTFCSDCRLQRRLMVRNERNMYHRECGLCKKSIISMYSTDKPFPVYCSPCWWSDKWDSTQYGVDYNFKETFFSQFQKIFNKVPRPALIASNIKNCDYCNYFADGKDCYLCFGSINVENCLYGSPYESKYCVDTYLARECEYCYECIDCEKLSNSIFAQDCSNSFDLIYCFDCKNCQDCIGCVGLRGQKYNIFNRPYSKEEYIKKRNELLSNGHNGFEEINKKFQALKLTVPHIYSTFIQSINFSGNHVMHSKDVKDCFDIKRCKDTSYCIRMIDGKDVYDANYCEFMELCYEYIGFWKTNQTNFSNTFGDSNNLTYADFCSGSSNLFGCIGLRSKHYYILNKQYTKEEYEKLISKIIESMNDLSYIDKKGEVYRYGEFFPSELSPFCYNETVAQEYFPLNKEEATKRGYQWKDREERNYKVDIPAENISSDINEDIIGKVIECSHKGKCNEQCTEAFKIIPEEFSFYKRMNLPLPTLCPNCRHYQRLNKRNPNKLWHRECMCDKGNHIHKGHCLNEFETSYAPDRPEMVYCEKCYQQEVY